jgi:hypothetical protein
MQAKYPIHPIAKLFPPLSEQEFAELKEGIRLNGQRLEITIYEEQVLDGTHRQKACGELGIEPQYHTPKIDNPYEYVADLNLRRRNMPVQQRAAIAAEMANMESGTRTDLEPSAKLRQVSQREAAKIMNVSRRSVQEAAKLKREAPEEFQAVKKGKVTRKPAKPKKEKSEFTPEEAAKNAQCLEYINRPSIFPTDAHIPTGGYDEVGLREAIAWLRENESRITTFSESKCGELLRCTNRIASYRDNYFKAPRLDGELDPRIMEWQQTLWQKRLRQEERIALERKLRHRSQSKMAPVKKKVRLPFEERFDLFWTKIESGLTTFKSSEQNQVVRAFREKLREFFADSNPQTHPTKICLRGQRGRIYELMKDGVARTVEQIQSVTGGSLTSVSADLRNLRKKESGSLILNNREGKYQLEITKIFSEISAEGNGSCHVASNPSRKN